MEPNENRLSYYHHHHQSPTTTTTTANAAASPTNGLLPNTHTSDGTHMVYPHSVPSAVTSPLEPAKRKRGRPRKYGTPEQALAAKKAATTSSHSSSSKEKKDYGAASPSYSGSSKKSQLVALGGCFPFSESFLSFSFLPSIFPPKFVFFFVGLCPKLHKLTRVFGALVLSRLSLLLLGLSYLVSAVSCLVFRWFFQNASFRAVFVAIFLRIEIYVANYFDLNGFSVHHLHALSSILLAFCGVIHSLSICS